MSETIHIESARWQTWTSIVDVRAVRAVEELESTGTPAERSGASIVDEFAEDLRRLADA